MTKQESAIRSSYDRVAERYAEEYFDELSRKPFDREVNICGVDLSAEMVKCASNRNPDISFTCGDMLGLDFADDFLAGIVCFYAIIHLRRVDVTRALKEMHRVLQPGGRLLVSFHGGEGEVHRDEWYGEPVSINVILMSSTEMAEYLREAGFEEVNIVSDFRRACLITLRRCYFPNASPPRKFSRR